MTEDSAPTSTAKQPAPPPTPNTNRRILYDLSTNAQLSPSRIKKFTVALIASETMKRKDLAAGGAVITPDGIQLAGGRKPLTLDELDKNAVHNAVKSLVSELNDEQKAKVEAAGLLEAPADNSTIIIVATSSGTKRAHSETATGIDPDEIELSEGDGEDMFDWNCDQVRRRINSFIESGEMKVTEFQKKIGVNSKSYGNFMKMNGPHKGMRNTTYTEGYKFFKKRELAGVKTQKKRKTSTATSKSASKASASTATIDISDVHLDGEETDSVEVYDSCDEIRRKISAHLRKDGVTQAAFLRDLAAQFKTQEVKLQSKQLNDFRQKNGADAGNTSRIFYAGYCFFEKLRIKEGKPKSKHRIDMEAIWGGKGGFDTKTAAHSKGYVVAVGSHVYKDEFGRVRTG